MWVGLGADSGWVDMSQTVYELSQDQLADYNDNWQITTATGGAAVQTKSTWSQEITGKKKKRKLPLKLWHKKFMELV